MKRFSFIFMGLVVLSAGCTLADVYGVRCQDWVNEGSSYEPDMNSYDVQEAQKAGYCPEGFVCTLNSNKQRICRTKCDENSFLCNDKCLISSMYSFSVEKVDGLDFCVASVKCSDSCKNGCAENGKCKCMDSCANGCDDMGNCKCADECKDNCNADGSCKVTPPCSSDCKNGCDEDGKCQCPSSCQDGCNPDGSCKDNTPVCSATCKNGCDEQGHCKCSESCKGHCNADGSCPCPESCKDNCDVDGKCYATSCSAICQHGCYDDGKCKCAEGCMNGCDSTGRCICAEDCENGCDENTGMCNPPCSSCGGKTCSADVCEDGFLYTCVAGILDTEGKKCELGCSFDGTSCSDCKANKCEEGKLSRCNADKSGYEAPIECVNGCDGFEMCKCASVCSVCNENGSCGSGSDVNGNHMMDYYEKGPNQGKSCKKHSDCDSTSGANDGFCDSFIGYKCSSKCNADSECMPYDTQFNYVCRPDGRCAPDTFETVWRIQSNGDSIVIPLIGAKKCQFDIDWGDNSNEKITTCSHNLTHEYTKTGDYHVKIKGSFSGWHTTSDVEGNDANAAKLIEVISFGPVGLDGYTAGDKYSKFAFANATNLTKLSSVDIPDASQLTSMKSMFEKADIFDHPIGNWDTSNVESMTKTFNNAKSFNQDIGNWNTSGVIYMDSMFANAAMFNKNINAWDTSQVITMANLFNGATVFNQNISSWNTSNVTNMSFMFNSANVFNQNISSWKTSKVTNMNGMFANAFKFNSDISSWNTSSVTNMSYLFYNAKQFNRDISNWNVTKLTDYTNIFCNSGLSASQKDSISKKWSAMNSQLTGLLNCAN